MTANLTQEQIQELKEAFSLFDTDHDGKISARELEVVLRSLGQTPSKNEVQDMINEMDIDHNGTIEFNEFLIMMSRNMQETQTTEELEEAFKLFDQDGNGLISPQELKNALKLLGEDLPDDEIHSMIKEADLNGDGQIDFKEFQQMMREKDNKK